MGHRIFVGGFFLFVAGMLPFGDTVVAAQKDATPGATQNQAQGQAAAPQYDPTADSIVTGLKGIATGAQAAFGSFNDAARTTQIQNALVKAIDAATDKSKVRLDLGNVTMLCDVRESYAQAKAHTDDVNAVTSALDAVATPATINSLGEAITDLFKKYSFTVKDNGAPAPPGATRDACIADLQAWAHYYYDGKDTAALKAKALAASTTPAPTGIDAFFGDLSAVSGIVGAIMNIITPIATYAAQQKDQAQRQAFIDSYLHDPGGAKPNKTVEAILAEARSLAAATNSLAVQARYVAVGQFVEKMTALRETPIDLTKVKSNDERCDSAITKYAGESEKLGLKTSAETATGNAILHFDAVPAWIHPGMNIYLTNGASPDATVTSLQGPGSVTMTIAAPKGGIAKGTAITFTAPDQKVAGATLPGEKATLETSAATAEGSKTLHFDPLPGWIVRGVKITAAKPALNAGVDAVTSSITSVEMDKNATGSVAKSANVQFTFSTASEGYVSCFAQASRQINQAVSDVVKAAANYDTAAQAQTSSDGLSSKLDEIAAATRTPNPPWPPSKDSPAAQDAAELAAFGDAMQKAFSQSNINALQSALDAAQKQFDIK